MRLKNWIRRSFRNRTFATILIATLLPLLLCDVVMMQVIVARTEHTQTRQGRDALDTLTARFTDTAALCGDTAETLAVSTITRSALRRTGEDSRLLYQFLYRQAAQLRPYADAAIYDAGGVCLYTTDAALPAAPLDTDWGALYAARRSDGTVFLSSNKGLLAARAVTGYGGQLLGYVTVRMESSGFAGCLTASWLPPTICWCWTARGARCITPAQCRPAVPWPRCAASCWPDRSSPATRATTACSTPPKAPAASRCCSSSPASTRGGCCAPCIW